jgi:hypothetical protein
MTFPSSPTTRGGIFGHSAHGVVPVALTSGRPVRRWTRFWPSSS